MFKTDSIISVLDRLLMIIICSILIWGHVTNNTLRIEWFVWAQTSSYFITAAIALIIVLSKTSFFKLNFDPRFFRVFLKKSYPYALLALLMSFYNRMDSIMLERMLINGKEQAGIYVQAFRILEAASMFAYLFSVLLLPMFAKMLKKQENVESLSKLSFLMIIIPAIIITNICMFYSYNVMELMYDEHFDQSAKILGVLMIGFLGICTTYIFGTLLTSNGNLKQLNIMATLGMVLNISLNFMLIPKYQVLGAAVSSMTTQLTTGIAQFLIAKKIFRFKTNYKFIISLSAFIIISVAITYLISVLNFNWIYSILASIIICLLLAFSTKLLSVEYIRFILKKHEDPKLTVTEKDE
jgi:O-antigen/teichoic acid export membrane protein